MLRQSYLHLKLPVKMYYQRLDKRYLTTKKNDIQNKNTENEVGTLKRPIKNEPFIKSLFAGKYEKDYLQFPEYTAKELKELETFIKPIESYYKEDAKSLEKIENYGENIFKLKEFQLYSLAAPTEFGNFSNKLNFNFKPT
jgi:hypothetical protein